jgi:hypothetical protein
MNGWKALGFKSYKEYLESDLWKSKRDLMINLRKKCEKCGFKNNLCVHHKTYFNVGNEDMDDLLVLCYDCHKEEHNEQ